MTLSGREAALMGVAGVLLVGLVAVASQGLIYGAVAIVFALVAVALLLLGSEATGTMFVMGAFAAAPMYRGIEGLTGGIATPTEVLLIPGILLLVPTLIQRKLEVPVMYVVAVALVASWGLIGSIAGGQPLFSIFQLAQWMFFLGGLPLIVAWWRPETKVVVRLLWCYLAGHMLSTGYALVEGPLGHNRYNGLAHHENAFGLGGLAAIAIVLFLLHHHRDLRVRVVLLGIGAAAALSVSMSGSRAALAVAIVLVLMVPVVEKSALWGFIFAACIGLFMFVLPIIVANSGEGSAIARLAGEGSASVADSARDSAYNYGIDRFLESPIFGTGLINVELIHNGYLEVAVAIGVMGLPWYLLALFVLARPLFFNHPLRRLSYLIWAFIGATAAVPSLWDRTLWVPISLAILPTIPWRGEEEPEPADDAGTAVAAELPRG